MLCTTLKSITRTCGSVSGSIARIWLFDPYDFDFTQAADAVDGSKGKYTTVALRETSTGLMLPIKFQKEEAEYKFTQSRKGCSVKYEHSLEFQLPSLDHELSNWNYFLDSAGCCCGVGVIIQLKSGKIFIAGELYVGGNEIEIPLLIAQDGSNGSSGKLLDDFNGENVVLKGNHTRLLWEYSGTAQSIIDLESA